MDVGIGGKEHHLGFRAEVLDFPEPVQSLVSRIDAAGEVHVEQYHVGMLLSQLGWDGVRVGDGDDAIEYRFQQHPYRSKNVAVVINNQYRSLFLCHYFFYYLLLKLRTFSKGLFLKPCTFFKGLFVAKI